MYNGMAAHGNVAFVYFLIMQMLGVFLMLNLFIAALCDGMCLESEEGNEDGDEEHEEGSKLTGVSSVDDPNSACCRLSDRSLFMFSKSSAVRRLAHTIMTHTVQCGGSKIQVLDQIVLLCIMVGCITMLLNNAHDLNPPIHFEVIDHICLGVFCIELAVKVIASGFMVGKGVYIRNSWNVLDFIIMVVSLLGVITDALADPDDSSGGSIFSQLKVLRALRALRLLRLIRRFEGMQIAVNSLLACVNPVIEASGVCLLMFFIFAIVGMDLFAGRLGRCHEVTSAEDVTVPYHAEDVSLYWLGGARPIRDWLDCQGGAAAEFTQHDPSFTNIFSSLSLLFQVCLPCRSTAFC